MKVHPYLNFDGQAEEAFNFYQSVFGGEIMTNMKMTEAPGLDHLSESERNRTMHIALPISDDILLMASDTLPSMGHKLVKGNQTHIMLSTATKEEADRIFNSLSQGGDVDMPIQDQFWGDYYGSFTDKFGIHWMVSFNENFT
jgi:PhnB protein